jgi:lipid A 3-O-deacylase
MRKLLAAVALCFTLTNNGYANQLFNSSAIYWENDSFGIGRKSDRFYTNGARVSLLLTDAPAWAGEFRRRFCNHGWCGDGQVIESASLFFGQNFYTPEIITIAEPQPLDRPWAGSLYGGISESITDVDQTLQHTFEVSLGVLGPGAGAQGTQKFVHNTLNFSHNDPQGWHNQLRNEPTFGLLYRQSRRVFLHSDVFDVVPQFGGMLGTLQTYANAGGVMRLGHHITGFPVGTIPGAAAPTANPPHKLEFYVFVGGDARWVPFNATLDGGFFRNGPKANGPKRFVTDFRLGASARYKRFRLTYSVVDRTAEFKVPAGHLGKQRFGSFALTFEPFTEFR